MCTIQIFNAYARVRRFVFSVGEKARGRRKSQQPAQSVTAKPDRQRERSKALDRFFSCSWFNLETCKTCSIFSSASTAVSTRFISEKGRTPLTPQFQHYFFQLFNFETAAKPAAFQQYCCFNTVYQCDGPYSAEIPLFPLPRSLGACLVP